MIILETNRAFLREWVPDDWKRFAILATDPRVMRYIGDGQPWSDERIRKFIDGGIVAAQTRGWILWPMICKADSELIGICGFNSAYAPEVEIGWWLRPEYWGKGLATEVAAAVMEYGWRAFGFERLISVSRSENRASIRVMEKLGMTFDRRFVHDGNELVAYAKNNPHPNQTIAANLVETVAFGSEETFEELLNSPNLRIERIVSTGQSSPDGFWFDQDQNEWVIVLRGAARLQFEPDELIEMRPGSYVNIPAHKRHRVEWTDPNQPTFWLAIHY
jgi:RimJ/RimL family protein N-acetyltransferase